MAAARSDCPVRRYLAGAAAPDLVALEGFHPLKHALRFGAAIELAITPDPAALAALGARLAPDLAQRLAVLVAPVPAAAWAQLGLAARNPVVALARRPALDAEALLASDLPRPLVLLDSPTHLGNLGAVVRVAAAAAAAGVVTLGGPDPWHPAALRGAAGLHFALPVARLERLPERLDRPLLALDPAGEPWGEALPRRALLAFGAEQRGLSPALGARAARRIAIPMRAGVSSLNLATAVAVVLYGPLSQ
jgi:TrmH family RNA methyltransferase